MNNEFLAKRVVVDDFSPMATPRPRGKVRYVGKKPVADVYTPSEYREYMMKLDQRLYDLNFYDDKLSKVLSESLEGVAVTILFELPFQKAQKQQGWTFAITKPDADNLAKAVLDTIFQSDHLPLNIITGKHFDDARVVFLLVGKYRATSKEEKGSIAVTIEPATDFASRNGLPL